MSDLKIETVMLIDDAEIDQRSYKRVLMRSGVVENVLTYTYADEALDYLSTNATLPIDVIYLDINMPRMDGFEFLEAASEKLGHQFAKIVIVMLTTSIDPLDRTRAENHPLVKDFLNKPLTVDHVLKIADMLRE